MMYFVDIRKHKTLIEYYNKEKQGYDIKHIQDQDSMYEIIM